MHRAIVRVTVLAAFAAGAAGTAYAQQTPPRSPSPPPAVNPALFQGLEYRLVGPPQGGRVTTVTGVPSQPRTFYMGVASGGVFKTTDGGESWFPVTDGQMPVGSTGDIAVALSDPNVVYVGTGSDGLRSNVSTGRGVYRSTDAGETWQFAGLYNVGQIGAVRIHPTNPNIVWVAANGDAFKPSPDRGIYKTVDGGQTWKKTLFVNDSTGAMDVELNAANPDIVYAWMNRIERKPWTIISGSRAGGFYVSTDGGETFQRRMNDNGLPNALIGKGNIAVTAANPNRLYALVEALPGGGAYRSDDGGQSWQALPSPSGMIQRPFYYTTLGADPTNADVVYGGAEGFWRSRDAGQTWQSLRTPHGDNHDIWVSPNDGNTMVQANDGGANVSFDGGATWSTQYNQPTSELYGVRMDDAFPYNLYAAQQDDGTHIISSIADMGTSGERGELWRSGPGCETGPILPHPARKDIVYGSCKGQYEVENIETGLSRSYWIGGQSLYGNDARNLILRFQRVSPMSTSPHDPNILYYGSQHLHRTRDMGETWETISPDLTWFPPHAQGGSGEPITRDVTGEEFYSTLYAITESPHQAGVIWTGSNDGPFHITRDNGRTWTDITPDMPEGGRVQWIDASPHRPGSAYYAVYRYLLGDYKPYIYRTDDYGQSWTLLTDGTNGIPADWPTRIVREDPDREGLLYAGTEFGLFISFDNGARWQPFQLNMPNVPITDIRVYKKDLVIATQGRGLWILDNISSLHQMPVQAQTQSQSQQGQPLLYAPRDGHRVFRNGGNLLGPMIEYYLPSVPQGPVRIEILDGSGAVVNAYSSDAPATAQAGGRGRGGRGGGGGRGGRGGRGGGFDPDAAMMEGREPVTGTNVAPVVARVTKAIGHNRFVWDVEYESGLTAPPGRYQARLTAGTFTATQPFNLLIDPRLALDGVSVEDLRLLFEHQQKMEQLVADLREVVQRVEDAQERLANATGAQAETRRQVQAIADKLFDVDVRYGQPGLETHISYLNRMTSGLEGHPGNQAIERYAVLRAELDALKAEVDRVLGGS